MMTASPLLHSQPFNHVTHKTEAELREEVNALCEEAKRLSLSAWFEEKSGVDCKFRNGKHHSTWCPYCGLSSKKNEKVWISGDFLWKCSACEQAGTIIDAEIMLFGGTPRQAAEHLLGKSHADFAAGRIPRIRSEETNEAKRERQLAEQRKYAAVATAVQKICRHSKGMRDKRVLEFLTDERCIPIEIVEEAIARNMLRTLPSNPSVASAFIRSVVSEDVLRAGDLWKEQKDTPWIAYRPLWFIMPQGLSAELRIIKKQTSDNTQKKSLRIGICPYPYFWEGSNPAGCGSVEGMLDVMSLRALGYEGDIMGVPGVNTWEPEWYTQLPQLRGTKRFDIFFDNDVNPDKFENPGQDAAVRLGAFLRENGLASKNNPPPAGDVNDFLRAKHQRL